MLAIKTKTHQVFADFYRILEHGPNHNLIASGGGQGAMVAVILLAINPIQESIQWKSRCQINRLAWGKKYADMFYSKHI